MILAEFNVTPHSSPDKDRFHKIISIGLDSRKAVQFSGGRRWIEQTGWVTETFTRQPREDKRQKTEEEKEVD